MKRILSSTFCLLFCLIGFASGNGGPSHVNWNSMLQRYVTSDGMVDYVAFSKDKRFTEYINTLSAVHPDESWSRNERLAYWLNAYNAFTVKLVCDNLPLKSIKDLGEPWDIKFIEIEGNRYSLNDIEHKIIRPQFKEPRIHFAVNCASKGCPPLYNRAFEAGAMESQLDKVSRNFVNDNKYNEIRSNSIALSKIFDWYRGDFDRLGGLVGFLKKYSKSSVPSDVEITFKEYDWKLNTRQ